MNEFGIINELDSYENMNTITLIRVLIIKLMPLIGINSNMVITLVTLKCNYIYLN